MPATLDLEHPSTRTRLTGLALLILALLAVYRPVLNADWLHWDDDTYVTDNDALRAPEGLRTIWATFNLEQYVPLVFTSYWLEFRAWGLDPRGYHAGNILLHVANTLLVLLLLRRLGAGPVSAACGAALFALHPVQVASVAWITERKNLLSTFFYLASFIFWLRGARDGRLALYLACLIAFLAALLGKSMAATLPLSLLAAEWLILRNPDRRRLLRLVPLAALALASALITLNIERTKPALALPTAPPWLVAPATLGFYLAKVLLPVGLSPIYPRWNIDPADPRWWLAPAAFLLIAAIIWKTRRFLRSPLLFALLQFTITLLPVLGLFKFRGLDITYVWHHQLYLPMTAVAFAAAVLFDRFITASRRRNAAFAVAASLLFALGLSARRETAVWRDSESLFARALAVAPDSAVANNGWGQVLLADQPAASIPFFNRAIALSPRLSEAHVNLGAALMRTGNTTAAVSRFRHVAHDNPTLFPAQYNLGFALAELGKLDEAAAAYRRAAALRPALPLVRFNLGLTFLRLGRVDEARNEFAATLALDPAYPRASEMLTKLTTAAPGRH